MDFSQFGPTTKQLDDAFVHEVRSLGGYVADRFDDRDRLFMRAVLPLTDDVAPGDTINGGIAIRAVGPAVFVHPYTMRQVCTNGAISAQATQSVRIERVAHNGIVIPTYDVDATLLRFSEAIHGCAAPEAFHQATDDMRSAMQRSLNLGIQFLQMMDRLPPGVGQVLMRHIFAEFGDDDEHTMFEYVNAITATARDTNDPELRWYLEEVGGTLMADVREPKAELSFSWTG